MFAVDRGCAHGFAFDWLDLGGSRMGALFCNFFFPFVIRLGLFVSSGKYYVGDVLMLDSLRLSSFLHCNDLFNSVETKLVARRRRKPILATSGGEARLQGRILCGSSSSSLVSPNLDFYYARCNIRILLSHRLISDLPRPIPFQPLIASLHRPYPHRV